MKSFLKFLISLIFMAGILLFLGGLTGAFYPPGDSLAVFRPYALLALLIAFTGYFLWGKGWHSLASILLLGLGLFSMWPIIPSSAPVAGLGLLQSNLRFTNDAVELQEYAQMTSPDIITLQEVTTKAMPQLVGLRDLYPYQVVCPFATVGGVAILSKYPFIGQQGQGCVAGQGMVSARIKTPLAEVTVVSVHLYWPWPFEQPAQIKTLLIDIQALEAPVIIAGDFNMVPWSVAIERIAGASDTRVIPGLRFTKSMAGRLVQLPIDHIFAPNGWLASATRGPKFGSDHNSLFARFEPN